MKGFIANNWQTILSTGGFVGAAGLATYFAYKTCKDTGNCPQYSDPDRVDHFAAQRMMIKDDRPTHSDYDVQPTGNRNNPLKKFKEQDHINKPTTIDGINYSGHAIDRMQERGVIPSVVKNTIEKGIKGIGNKEGTFKFSDPINGVEVITNKDGVIITVKLIGKQ